MSLFDALLLDPAPFDLYIAYRTDGIAGSGTLNDPLNCASRWATPLAVTSLTRSVLEATAVVSSVATLSNGDFVTISGVTGGGASRWNGTFPIYNVNSGTNTFQYRMTDTPLAAAGGTITAAKVTAFPFDDVMNGVPENTRVHLGTTPEGQPFLTKGYAEDGSAAWQLKPGLKIAGAGIESTVVQLLGGSDGKQYFAFGHDLTKVVSSQTVPNPMDTCEISDLTIDSNHTPPGTNHVACGGARLMGDHVRLQRIKTINWGNNLASDSSFVLAIITAEPSTSYSSVNVAIESCVALAPGASTTKEVLVMHVGGKNYNALSDSERFGTGARIRDCFVDGGITDVLGDGSDFRKNLVALSLSSCKAGVVQGNHIQNTWIAAKLAKWSARDATVRGNFFKNVTFGLQVDFPAPPTPITNSAITVSALVVEVTTGTTPHNLIEGDRVKISGVVTSGDNGYNGVFVVSVVSSTKFRYRVPSAPGAISGSNYGGTAKVLGVETLVTESNTVELAQSTSTSPRPIAIQLNCDSAAALGSDYSFGTVMIRDNSVRYLDAVFDTTFTGVPLRVVGVRNLFVQGNVVESAPTDQAALVNSLCGTVNYFNNLTPAGELVLGLNSDTDNNYSELETEAEDALLLALTR